jgi:hypothetical protein
MIDGEVNIEHGIAEAEEYANQYIPERSQAFANKVEEYANDQIPPSFNHAGLDYLSPMSDNELEKIRNRIGDDSEAITFVDLQQIVAKELTDLEDQQSHLSKAAAKKCGKMINNLKFIEEATLKIISNEILDGYEKKTVWWYLNHNIDRWNRKIHKEDDEEYIEDIEKIVKRESINSIAAQNGSYFASLYDKLGSRTVKMVTSNRTQDSQTHENTSEND